MKAIRNPYLIAVLLWPFAAAACSHAAATGARPATGVQPATEAQPATETQPTTPDRTAAEIEALYRARTDSARSNFTAADTRFMTAMIHHHAQALEMARLAPTHGAGEQVQTLAARIINAQRDEIATMQRWLRDRGQPVPELRITESEVMVHGGGHAMHVPTMAMAGMATPEQMRELASLHGKAFERMFLTLMIEHHRGAVTMVHELFATDGAGQDDEAFKIASDAQVDQSTEIARMERMLERLGSESSDG